MNQDEARQDRTASIQTVAIGDLKEPGDFYPRLQPNSEVVEHYQELLDNMPPIAVAQSDDPSLNMRILDGVHRTAAAFELGWTDIEAIHPRNGKGETKCQ